MTVVAMSAAAIGSDPFGGPPGAVSAQVQTLESFALAGQVTDALTGLPVEGAAVRSGVFLDVTGPDGAFTLDRVSGGTTEILVTAPGYLNDRSTLTLARERADVHQWLQGDTFWFYPRLVPDRFDLAGSQRFQVMLPRGEEPGPGAVRLLQQAEAAFDSHRALFQQPYYHLQRTLVHYTDPQRAAARAGNPIILDWRFVAADAPGYGSVASLLAHEVAHGFVNAPIIRCGFGASLLGPLTVIAEYRAGATAPDAALREVAAQIDQFARGQVDAYEALDAPFDRIDWDAGHHGLVAVEGQTFQPDYLVAGMLLRVADRTGWDFVAEFLRLAPPSPGRPFADAGPLLLQATGGRIADLLDAWHFPPADGSRQ
jgi:hypothetical protein